MPSSFMTQLSALTFNVLTPCLVLARLSKQLDFSKVAELWPVVVWSLIHIGVGVLVGHLLFRFSDATRSFKAPFVLAIAFNNALSFPLMVIEPIVQTEFFRDDETAAERAYMYPFIYTLGWNILIYSYGYVGLAGELMFAQQRKAEEAQEEAYRREEEQEQLTASANEPEDSAHVLHEIRTKRELCSKPCCMSVRLAYRRFRRTLWRGYQAKMPPRARFIITNIVNNPIMIAMFCAFLIACFPELKRQLFTNGTVLRPLMLAIEFLCQAAIPIGSLVMAGSMDKALRRSFGIGGPPEDVLVQEEEVKTVVSDSGEQLELVTTTTALVPGDTHTLSAIAEGKPLVIKVDPSDPSTAEAPAFASGVTQSDPSINYEQQLQLQQQHTAGLKSISQPSMRGVTIAQVTTPILGPLGGPTTGLKTTVLRTPRMTPLAGALTTPRLDSLSTPKLGAAASPLASSQLSIASGVPELQLSSVSVTADVSTPTLSPRISAQIQTHALTSRASAEAVVRVRRIVTPSGTTTITPSSSRLINEVKPDLPKENDALATPEVISNQPPDVRIFRLDESSDEPWSPARGEAIEMVALESLVTQQTPTDVEEAKTDRPISDETTIRNRGEQTTSSSSSSFETSVNNAAEPEQPAGDAEVSSHLSARTTVLLCLGRLIICPTIAFVLAYLADLWGLQALYPTDKLFRVTLMIIALSPSAESILILLTRAQRLPTAYAMSLAYFFQYFTAIITMLCGVTLALYFTFQ